MKQANHVNRIVGEKYMNSKLAERMIPTLLVKLDEIGNIQSGLNNCYSNLVEFILKEAQQSNPRPRKRWNC